MANLKYMELPLLPLRGMMIFPGMVLHFDVARPRSIAALEASLSSNQKIFLTAQKNEDVEEPTRDQLYEVGTVAVIRQVMNLPGENVRVLVEGEVRGILTEYRIEENYAACTVQLQKDRVVRSNEGKALVRTTQDLVEAYAQTSQRVSREMVDGLRAIEKPGELADLLAAHIVQKWQERQEILSELDPLRRLEKICAVLMRETDLADTEKEIQSRIRRQVERNQKDYYLREQIRAIQTELGEEDEGAEQNEFRKRLEETPLNEEARAKCEKEIERLGRIAPGSPEYVISETYIDWILDMPWGKQTEDNLDLKRAREILDREHYGLEKVKERIIEYLAVLRMKKNMKGPIICFVGPPGVGKTSIVKAIAEAVDRKFVRMSLGGVRDEAEIRGHRKTYIGAMPGRIISGMKQAGSMNPVFLFDEIDKMASDFRGDPASAMLEVLDAEQNFAFRDHYMEIPFDLSKVMFITTANSAETIPEPLRDRMEMIEVPSYTEEEKLQILKRHLLPKQMKEHGMDPDSMQMSEEIMKRMIEDYTREAGVRTLERTAAKCCRKAAVYLLEKGEKSVKVDQKLMHEFLGAARYTREPLEKEARVGIVNGLAWTSVGGETLEVECATMPGKGNLKLTGQLGDVMKESAEAAFSWVRAHSGELGLAEDFYTKLDIHIHLPEGAVPKDGPSAGITMTTALVSALTGKKARQDVAMTGEMTLRGRVLPIGGLKEKTLAAYRAGINVLIIPKENHKDLEDIPEYVRARFRIVEVEEIQQVLKETLRDNDGDQEG
ncbi:MAG: endopeptidase La [Clostridia bacterium]|nr:endopeptidase La [Clostridia bacterium]